jgi:hypothetical protein
MACRKMDMNFNDGVAKNRVRRGVRLGRVGRLEICEHICIYIERKVEVIIVPLLFRLRQLCTTCKTSEKPLKNL